MDLQEVADRGVQVNDDHRRIEISSKKVREHEGSMTPQIPHPDGKFFCVSYTTVSFTYFDRFEDAVSHHLATLNSLKPEGYDEGVIVQLWESLHGKWLSDPVNDITELRPKPVT